MIDTKNLRQLAEAATHGPWRHNKDNEQIGDVSLRDSDQTVAQAMMQVNGTWQQRDKNAAYIAACSPDVLLALLDALGHKDAEIERLTAELGDLPEAQAMLLSDCKRKDALLRRALAVICWKCFGECRMQGVADLPTASEIEADIETELGEI